MPESTGRPLVSPPHTWPANRLRSQLNQIRAWVQQGRTEAWIAHQLDVSASELRDFIRRNELSADAESTDDVDLRDEIEAEIEATMEAEDDEEAEDEEEAEADEEKDEEDGEEQEGDDEPDDSEEDSDDGGDAKPRTRGRQAAGDEGGSGGGRRRRRRRRGPKRAGAGLEATFDHGDDDGYGLWLDPAVRDDPVYAEHWKGHRAVEVTVEPDRIIIRRSGATTRAAWRSR